MLPHLSSGGSTSCAWLEGTIQHLCFYCLGDLVSSLSVVQHFTICSVSYVPMRSFFYMWNYNMKIHICLHSLYLLLFVKHWEVPWHNTGPSMKTYQALKPCFIWSTPKMTILAERAVLGISNHFPSLEFWADSWHFWQCSLKSHSQKFVLQSSQKLSFILLMQNLIFSAKHTFQQV